VTDEAPSCDQALRSLAGCREVRFAAGAFARAVIRSGIQPAGRSVTRATGLGLYPATGRNRKARTRAAKIAAAWIVAKLAPMYTRGPPPNGNKA